MGICTHPPNLLRLDPVLVIRRHYSFCHHRFEEGTRQSISWCEVGVCHCHDFVDQSSGHDWQCRMCPHLAPFLLSLTLYRQSYTGLAAFDFAKCIQRRLMESVRQVGRSSRFLCFGLAGDIIMLVPTRIAILTGEYARCLWVLRLELSRKVFTALRLRHH